MNHCIIWLNLQKNMKKLFLLLAATVLATSMALAGTPTPPTPKIAAEVIMHTLSFGLAGCFNFLKAYSAFSSLTSSVLDSSAGLDSSTGASVLAQATIPTARARTSSRARIFFRFFNNYLLFNYRDIGRFIKYWSS